MRGRELLGNVSRAVDGYAAHDPVTTGDLLESMAAYATLLRHHNHTEDHVFYPMAKKTLTDEELEQLSKELAKERDKHGGDAFERNHKLVVDMGSIITHLREPAR